jgi:hypothetical protein
MSPAPEPDFPHDRERIQTLIDLLVSKDPAAKDAAMQELAGAGESAVALLIEALRSDDVELRGAAAHVLGRLGAVAEPAIPALIEALGDPSPLSVTARHALVQIGPAAVPALNKRLDAYDTALRAQIVLTLEAINSFNADVALSRSRHRYIWDRARILAMFMGTGVFVLVYIIVALSGEPASAVLFLFMPLVSSMAVAACVSRPEHIAPTCALSLFVNLLVSFLFLGEGIICAAMAAPVFIAMNWLGAWTVRGFRTFTVDPENSYRRRKKRQTGSLLILLVLAYTAYDAVVMAQGVPVRTVVTVLEVNASPQTTWRALSFTRPPRIDFPFWLRWWIPRPQQYAFSGEGSDALRCVDFGDRQPGDDGDTPRGRISYEMTVLASGQQCLFACRDNPTVLQNWLTHIDTTVTLEPVAEPDGSVRTRITFSTRYQRKLGPALYFVPFMDAAVDDVHEVLGAEIRENIDEH